MLDTPHKAIEGDRRLGRWRTCARHEAAHAAVCLALGGSAERISVFYNECGQIEGRFERYARAPSGTERPVGGVTIDNASYERLCQGLTDRSWAADHLTVSLAGFAFTMTEDTEDAFSHSQDDYREALILARAMSSSEAEAENWCEQCLQRAARIVDQNRAAISRLGDRLAAAWVLEGDEIKTTLGEAGPFPAPEGGTAESYTEPRAWPSSAAALHWRGIHLSGLRTRSSIL